MTGFEGQLYRAIYPGGKAVCGIERENALSVAVDDQVCRSAGIAAVGVAHGQLVNTRLTCVDVPYVTGTYVVIGVQPAVAGPVVFARFNRCETEIGAVAAAFDFAEANGAFPDARAG